MNFPCFRNVYFKSKRINDGIRGNLFWNFIGLFWERFFKRFPPHRKLIEEIVKMAGVCDYPPGFFLDAGCGPGILGLELARRGHKVVAVDRSPEMLRRAEATQNLEHIQNIVFLQGDLNHDLGGMKQSFSKIFFIHSLYLLEEPEKTLKEAASALVEEGEIVMCNPCRRLRTADFLSGGWSFLKEAFQEKNFLSFLFLLNAGLGVGALHLLIQKRKKKIYHCWEEEEIEELLKTSGLKLKWSRRCCLGNSHIFLCAGKERK